MGTQGWINITVSTITNYGGSVTSLEHFLERHDVAVSGGGGSRWSGKADGPGAGPVGGLLRGNGIMTRPPPTGTTDLVRNLTAVASPASSAGARKGGCASGGVVILIRRFTSCRSSGTL